MQGIQAEVALCNARMQRAWVKAAMQDPSAKSIPLQHAAGASDGGGDAESKGEGGAM